MSDGATKHTPLHAEHVRLGARMVPFAGYDMPVQYATGIIAEHTWTRSSAGLFDVSHMGQCFITGPDFETAARAMETLVPADLLSLAPGQQRYSQLLSEAGGILDDLMIARMENESRLHVVVNAARKEDDFAWIAGHLPPAVTLERGDGLALLALQGSKAEDVLARHAPALRHLSFMHRARSTLGGISAQVSRSGYTGEDGFEISVDDRDAVNLWNLLLADSLVKPIGLGARDSLRLEAGLCLYGHDIDEGTSPVEADLVWSIGRRRRGEGGFVGAARVQRELSEGVSRKRVGLKPEGRAPAREGTAVTDPSGRAVGSVTSGGFGPTVGGPIAMGYVESPSSVFGTSLRLTVRGSPLPATVVKPPFVPHRFKR